MYKTVYTNKAAIRTKKFAEKYGMLMINDKTYVTKYVKLNKTIKIP